MNNERRTFLMHTLFGAGLLGLRSLATGIPISMLAQPLRAFAQSTPGFANPQYLILNTSQAGDPLNCNAPGTYLDPKIVHPADPRMAKTTIRVGDTDHQAAAPWATLAAVQRAPNLFARTSFIHHSTGTEQHLHQPDVHGIMGKVVDKDMAVSAFARLLSPVLGTIQKQPVVIGTDDSSEAISYQNRPQPLLNPMSLATVLGAATGPLGTLQKLRDQDLNRLNALLKANGTPGQRRILDDFATSQNQVRQISSSLLAELSAIKSNGAESQMQAAIVLIKMKVAPVVTVHIPFGGDNHFDGDLSQESDQTVTGMAAIAKLMNGLGEAQLLDKVTFGSFNVFGRTLLLSGAGRNHNRNHHMTLLVGKNVKGSVIGGLTPTGEDYGALPISSTSGKGASDGDILPADSLASVAKTMGAALGISSEQLDKTILYQNTGAAAGKIIKAALA